MDLNETHVSDIELEEIKEDKTIFNKEKLNQIEIEDLNKIKEIQNKIINNYKNIDVNNKKTIIKVENLYKSYLLGLEGVPALRGINLEIKQGEFVIIMGTSGGGKTTLLNCLGTIDQPTRGLLKIEDKIILDTTKDKELSKLRMNKIGFVFQSFNLINSFNAIDNVKLPMQIKGNLTEKQIEDRAILLLKKFNLEHRIFNFPNQLSGGEQQRVTIARALANQPNLLLLDEPTGDLDTKNSDIVLHHLIELNKKEGITMIMVTHEEELKNYANRVIHVQDGKIKHISINSEEKREEKINELEENLKNNKLRTGIDSQNNSKTSYRIPSDYPYFKYINEKYN